MAAPDTPDTENVRDTAVGDHSETGGPRSLRRRVTTPLLLVFVLGDVLGAGIYALVGTLEAEVGGAVWLPLVIALLLALLTAGSYAELVTKYPRSGASAVFVQRAFGRPVLSFLVGFAMLGAGLTSAAALATAFAGEYLQELVATPEVPTAIVFLVLVALVNARGISESLRANIVMTLVELTGLVLVVVAAVVLLGSGGGDVSRVTDLSTAGEGTALWSALGGAVFLAFYSYVGFETSANIAEETVDPRRSYPTALLGGVAIAGVAYLVVGLAVSASLPADRAASGDGPFLEIMAVSPLSVPGGLFSVIALVAIANGALLTMIMASRLAYGMATEGLLPSPLAAVLPGRRTPGAAIAATTLVAVVLLLTGGLEAPASTTVLLLLVVFFFVNVCVLVLRREGKSPLAAQEEVDDTHGTDTDVGAGRGDRDHFRIPTVLPVLGAASCVVLATQQEAESYLRAALVLLVGLALYGVQALARRRDRTPGAA
ncbi:amino acid/polyamine/organocation transporter (APC superfamily) [Terracoccus luteus]|uniref:Amino acid/polyamine/organocation transporter (APC superfamily) n=1 Tax=Terracoccus luteus TaxID=53356 RepID=A0A495XXZ5_9MICO|nr:APC family permease [Terracoccus luteus]RKT76618.1 amino acid/polyamine/organocation transporter (APC superfamily) [Terracoccus luteus]